MGERGLLGMPADAKDRVSTFGSLPPEPRVLIVGNSVEGGGAERRLSLMADYLFSGAAELAVLRAPKHAKRATHDLGWSGPNSYPRVIWRLRSLLRRGVYDVAVAFDRHPIACLAIAAIGLARRPAFVAMEVIRPKSVAKDGAGNWRTLILTFFERWAYRRADVVAANSTDGAEECVTHYGVPRSKMIRVNNLLPIAEFRLPAPRPTRAGDMEAGGIYHVCVVSRLVPFKRVDIVVEALASLPADIAWRLAVAGAGPERRTLEEQVHRAGVADSVTFHGWLQDPWTVVRGADVFVQASNYEGFANAVLEAMAVGVPVITSTGTSDAREMVRRGAALGFEPGDAQGLRDALLKVRSIPSLRDELVRNATHYIQPFNATVAIGLYESAILKALHQE